LQGRIAARRPGSPGLRRQYLGSVNIEYSVNVDSLVPRNLSFRTIVDHELVPRTIVTDLELHRRLG
jgi:hypothetical protein